MWELSGKNWAQTPFLPATDFPFGSEHEVSIEGAEQSGSRRLDTRRGLNEREEEE